jgi:hypothetical protein
MSAKRSYDNRLLTSLHDAGNKDVAAVYGNARTDNPDRVTYGERKMVGPQI